MKRAILAQIPISVLVAVALADEGDMLHVVRDGQPVAVVVCADDASEQLQYAVGVLRDCIENSSGARLTVSREVPADGGLIYVGRGPWVSQFKTNQEHLDDDGFEIRFPDARSVMILGPSDWGTEFGIYEFLERYVGVRWLIPGPKGTHIPQHRDIQIPRVHVREEPAFFARYWSGLKQGAWMRTCRMPFRGVSKRLSFHHNLEGGLFPLETYRKTNPEFFPLIDGKRFLPKNVERHKWQPCFTDPAVVTEAVKNITEYFDKNPEAVSYSLGINDTGPDRWCQCEGCRAQYSGKNNSIGQPDYSDLYHGWCNRVIEGVLEEHPGKWFGCLAYNNVFDPPSTVKVHSRLVPYICMDRMQWADEKRREHGHAFHQRWLEQTSTLGWYDYIYGRQYRVPRVYCHQMADYLRYARRNGVRGYYAEAYPPSVPNWGEGPKLYVTSRLLWNPDLDVDSLLRDWYVCFAGEAAADHLAEYYVYWEKFWTQQVLKTPWFGDTESPHYKPRQYLDFKSTAYFDAITLEEIVLCRQMLESASAKTRTDAQRTRVRGLLDAFDASETTFLFHRLQKDDRPPAEVLTALLKGDIPESLRQKVNGFLDVFQGRAALVSRNPSFKSGNGKPDNWTLWIKPLGDPPHGKIEWTESPRTRPGKMCLRVKGIKRGGPVQAIPAKPGRYVMRLSYMVPEGQRLQTIEMNVTLKDSKGKDFHTDTVTVEAVPGKWRLASRYFDVPKTIANMAVASIQFSVVTNRMGVEEEIHYDDIGIYRLPE